MAFASCNIADAVGRMAALQPDRPAVVVTAGRSGGRRSYAHWTFAQLEAESAACARGLLEAGFGRGERAVLMVTPGLDFFALAFGMLRAGVVPVLIDPGLGTAQLSRCLAEARPSGFIGVSRAHAAQRVLGWAKETVTRRVTVGPRLFWGGHTLAQLKSLGRGSPLPLPDTAPDEVAAVLFTSGSTGIAKGVVYLHRHFVAQVEMIRDTYGIQPGEVDLPTFPPFALFDPALGMTAVLPEMDFTRPARVDPSMLLELLEDWKVTSVFGSPGLLGTVARHGARHGVKWPDTVRRVLSAGAPVPVPTLEGMHRLLADGAEIFTPYGATECLPVASIGSREVLKETRPLTDAGAGVCVGRVVPPNDVRILRIQDGPLREWAEVEELPAGEVGEIAVLGPTTTERYFEREEATLLAKVRRDGRKVHRMGDVGYLDAQGRLWFCGRKGHRVELPGRTLYTAQVEEVLNVHPAVFRTALVGVQREGQTVPVICVEREPGVELPEAQLFAELRALCERQAVTAGLDTFLIHPGFPVDIRHNAKIGREKLAAWAQERLG
ncbi:MAG: AMP-binding protein [Deltaproteobacteria bacterium]|nr:AMP-binding protein [Deltaproteobacteria bacterium]